MVDDMVSSEITERNYHCAPGIGWSVEIRNIILINKLTGSVCNLSYPEAAVWDLISRGYSFDKLVGMLSVISAKDSAEAKRFIVQTVDDLTEEGFLIKSKANG